MTLVLTRFTTNMHITHTTREPKEFLSWYLGDRIRDEKFRKGHVEPVNCVHIHHEEDLDKVRIEWASKVHNDLSVINIVMRSYKK